MNLFDAVAHAFSTVSTAGFSPYDASLAHFDNIGDRGRGDGVHVPRRRELRPALHRCCKRRDPGGYWRDTEFKAYFLLTAVVTGFATLYLYVMQRVPDPAREPAARRLPGGLDADHHRTPDRGFRALARRAARAARAARLRRRLRRLDDRRHEGHPLADRLPPGRRRAQAARAPERGDPGQARRPPGAAADHPRRRRLLRDVPDRVRGADAAAHDVRHGPGDGMVRGRRVAQQRRPRASPR